MSKGLGLGGWCWGKLGVGCGKLVGIPGAARGIVG